MLRLHVNNYSSSINGAILAADTTIEVSSATGLPSPTGGDFFTLTLDDEAGTVEIVFVTARTGTTLTVIRGQDGTSALNWPDLTLIEQRLTAPTIDSKITQLSEDASPQLAADLDCNNEEILNALRVRTDLVSKASDTTNNIWFTTSKQTFRPFNVDVMNLTSAGMQLGGANTRVNTILDEDDMVSDSNVALCSQQSIKAYIDNSITDTDQERVKAWVHYNSIGVVTILDSYNIASISDDGVGQFTITFTTPFLNIFYSMAGMAKQNVVNKLAVVTEASGGATTTTSVQINTVDNTGLEYFDDVSVIFIGDQ